MLILDRDAIPPRAGFCDADVAYVLAYLTQNGNAGKGKLASYLGLGRTSFRSLITLMINSDLVETSEKMVKISANGSRLYMAMGIDPLDIDIGYSLGTYKQAIKVSGAADRITNGVNQVKISTMFGGVGCSLWIMKNHTLYMPPHLDFNLANKGESERIIDSADLRDGDVLLVCGAENPRTAKVAAMMVALDLV